MTVMDPSDFLLRFRLTVSRSRRSTLEQANAVLKSSSRSNSSSTLSASDDASSVQDLRNLHARGLGNRFVRKLASSR